MYEKECMFLLNTAKAALKKSLRNPKHTKSKSEYDVVTEVDMSVEAYLVEEIHKNYPKDTIISEETNSHNAFSKRTWVLDPIDGTWNFMGGMPLFGFQGALCVEERPVMSVIILPALHEEYYATKGGGAYRNGQRIEVKPKENLHQTIVSCSDFKHDRPLETQPAYLMQRRIYDKIGRLRGFGASCVDFTSVACGRTDGTVIVCSNPWDVLPGSFLCREAGALVCDLRGKKYHLTSDGIVAVSSEKLQDVIVAALTEKHGKR